MILAAMVVVGLLLYLTDIKYFRHHHSSIQEESGHEKADIQEDRSSEVCCGMHLVCEKTSLAVVTDEIEYYDDEELDRFQGRNPESYTSAEIEEFRDVLMTLLPQDVAGWARSISIRKIELPVEVKDELLLLVSELRNGSISY